MKTLILIIALSILTTAPCMAADPWSKQDIALEGAVIALLAVDWAQTRYISTHPDQFYERNPLLGEHPSRKNVDLYFAGAVAAHIAITHFLPAIWRPGLQVPLIVLQFGAVTRNNQIGIGMRF